MKKIIITGASEGIGLETAKLLAQKGNQLLLVARNKEKLIRVIGNLPGTGHGYLVADLSKKEDAERVAEHITQIRYDVLINNAGVGMYGRFEEMSLGQQVALMHLNMFGMTILSHSFIKNADSGDALVNVASTLGTSSFPGTAVYAATKAFVSVLSDSLWWENKTRGIYVLGFCPGVTHTKFHESSGGSSSSEMYPKFIIQSPVEVASELVHALEKRKKPKVVSGAMNRMMLFFQRFLSRKMTVNMMGSFSLLNK